MANTKKSNPVENRTSSKRRTVLTFFVVLLGVIFAVGYMNWGLFDHLRAIPPHVSNEAIITWGEEPELPPCERELNFDLSLATLKETASAGCDFADWKITVSDTVTLDVPRHGSVAEKEKCPSNEIWGITNLGGNLGVVVYTPTKIWGDERATSLVQEAGWPKSLGIHACQTNN